MTRVGGRRSVHRLTAFDPSPKTCTPSAKVAAGNQQRPTGATQAGRNGQRRDGFHGPHRKRRCRNQRRRRRCEKRACSDTIEESSSVDEVDVWRKRSWCYKESSCFRLTHFQSDTSLHLHITTLRAHGLCSNEVWYPERASVHLTISRNLRCQSSSALPPLNDVAHGGHAGTRDQPRTRGIKQQKNAPDARGVSTKRRLSTRQSGLSGTTCSCQTRRQRRPLHQPRHQHRCQTLGHFLRRGREGHLRCAQCGPDPAAFTGATDHGLMLLMVQKHGGQQLTQESVAQLRNLDRAACEACDTIRSRRCHRCRFCKSDKPLQSSWPVPPGDLRRQLASELSHSGHRPHRARQAVSRRTSQSFRNGSSTLQVSRDATAWAESLEGAISGHQSWAVLCRYRCRLMLAEAPKGSDRNAELKQRLRVWEGG